jgi:hypothetical protein
MCGSEGRMLCREVPEPSEIYFSCNKNYRWVAVGHQTDVGGARRALKKIQDFM